MSNPPVEIILYSWAGSWGPFQIKIPCGECSLTKDVIRDTLRTELANILVTLHLRDWLTEWWRVSNPWSGPKPRLPFRKYGWMAITLAGLTS